MKFKIISVFTALLFINHLYAQQLKAGLKGGINYNKLSGNPFADRYSPNFHFGGFLSIRLCQHLSLQPELIFTKISTDTSFSFNYEYNFKRVKKVEIEYLYLPILFNLKITKFLTLQGGPQANFLLHDNLKPFLINYDAFKEVEIAGTGGLAINFKRFSIYGRYSKGINTQNNIHEGENWKHESILAGIQYTFIRKK